MKPFLASAFLHKTLLYAGAAPVIIMWSHQITSAEELTLKLYMNLINKGNSSYLCVTNQARGLSYQVTNVI